MMVPILEPVPVMPLTLATEPLSKRSEGRQFAMVLKAAYENVASANREVIATRFTVEIVGIRVVTPIPPKTTRALRALPSDHPRLMSHPEAHPPKKLPRSAAMNGTQTAMNPLRKS